MRPLPTPLLIVTIAAAFGLGLFARGEIGAPHAQPAVAGAHAEDVALPAPNEAAPTSSQDESALRQKLRALADWKRPEGPPKVALQAGHWKTADVPEELENLKFHGATKGGVEEWTVNLAVAQKAAALLEADGFIVDVLPATIPTDYYADVFVALHADENRSRLVGGFKSAAPLFDVSGRAAELSRVLDEKYAEATGLPHDDNEATDDMRGYYAFNWLRFEHALHPMTPAAIIEMGYLTNVRDKGILLNAQEKAARGVADAVESFLLPTNTAQ